jgi:putative effector of murein hydrolase
MGLTYKTPHKYEDSDLWFRFFTKTDLLILALPVYVDFKILSAHFSGSVGEWFFAALIAALILIPFLVIAKMTVPKNMAMYGGGITCKKMALRLIAYYLCRSGRTIYIRNYDKNWEAEGR